MSRIGRKEIIIPQGVEVKIEGLKLTAKGQKGELTRTFRPEVKIEMKDNVIATSIKTEEKLDKSLWGLTRMLIFNMVEGVSKGFEKKLEIQGVGFRAEVAGKSLNMNLGFSHPVNMEIPEGIQVSVEKNIITVSGTDKELVGQFSANIRKKREPEPYKGKGIRYVGEIIRRKVGKKVAATGAAK
ncbi:MAG: 50S ribosomal protein L6 [Candidatus Paceibacterota bacterium]|jgi:large subunit ribosomal protein L6